MQINEAIRSIMKRQGMTYSRLATAIGKSGSPAISAILCEPNMKMKSALKLAEALGYELVLQERKGGQRRADQIVVTKEAEKEALNE